MNRIVILVTLITGLGLTTVGCGEPDAKKNDKSSEVVNTDGGTNKGSEEQTSETPQKKAAKAACAHMKACGETVEADCEQKQAERISLVETAFPQSCKALLAPAFQSAQEGVSCTAKGDEAVVMPMIKEVAKACKLSADKTAQNYSSSAELVSNFCKVATDCSAGISSAFGVVVPPLASMVTKVLTSCADDSKKNELAVAAALVSQVPEAKGCVNVIEEFSKCAKDKCTDPKSCLATVPGDKLTCFMMLSPPGF